MAKHFKCSTKVVYERLAAKGLSLRRKFSNLTDAELDAEVGLLKESFPNAGAQVILPNNINDGSL